MKVYIDFDNTLFNTPLLTNAMLNHIVNEIIKVHTNLIFDDVFIECKGMFNREHIYNIYDLAIYFSKKYELNLDNVMTKLNDIIAHTEDFVYEDTIPFLQKLKCLGHNLYILSYCPDSLKYQAAKISGSGISNYFDAIYITAVPKYELDINYQDGFFIDDNPQDLLGLYSKNPKQVIRIRRDGNKYSSSELDNSYIKEYKLLNEINF